MYKFFITENQISNNKIQIIEEDVNHIKNVLRLKRNDEIEVCDIDNKITYECQIDEINSTYVRCNIIKKIDDSRETNIYLHIFQGLPKAEKMESIIQKTTEIGVSEITPIIMNRCVVKLDNKTCIKKNERWKKIAEVAAKQSKRDKIPIINLPIDIKNIYEKIKDYDIVLVAYENEKNNTLKHVLQNTIKRNNLKIAIIIGPEGGIEQKEIEQLKMNKVNIVTLGKRILRTETAPVVLASLIMYEFDEMI